MFQNISFVIQSFKPEQLNSVDKRAMTVMINKSFSTRGLNLVRRYWDKHPINQYPVSRIYLANEKMGGAVIRNLDGVDYMCKLFILPAYRGQGLATQIMEKVCKDYPGVVWRTSKNSDSFSFYTRFIADFIQSSNMKKDRFTGYEALGEYYVFGINVSKDKWESTKRLVVQLPATLVKK